MGSAGAMTYDVLYDQRDECEKLSDVNYADELFVTNTGPSGEYIQFPQLGWDGYAQGDHYMDFRGAGAAAVDFMVVGDTLSRYTGFKPNPPAARAQRFFQRGQGYINQYASSGMQVYCNGGAMFINTATIRHKDVVGGGYNGWFGKTFQEEVPAFHVVDQNGVKRRTSLAVQVRAAAPYYKVNHPNQNQRVPGDQSSKMFAFKSKSRPDLHPLVMVVAMFDGFVKKIVANPEGFVGCDFGPRDDLLNGVGGVHFSGSYLTPENVDPFVKLRYVESERSYTQVLQPKDNPDEEDALFRTHIDAEGFSRFIARVNAKDVSDGSCPANGYPTDVDDYVLSHVAIISETVLFNGKEAEGSLGDLSYNQVASSFRWRDLIVLRVYD